MTAPAQGGGSSPLRRDEEGAGTDAPLDAALKGAAARSLNDIATVADALGELGLASGVGLSVVLRREALLEVALDGEQVVIADLRPLAAAGGAERDGDVNRLLDRLAMTPGVIVIGEPGSLSTLLGSAGADRAGSMLTWLTWPLELDVLVSALRNVAALLRLEREVAEGRKLAGRYRYELSELFEIGRAVNSTRDIDRLLHIILEKSRYITAADAGSVFVVEEDPHEPGQRRLRFKASQNESVTFEPEEFTLPIDERSVVGACVVQKKVINVADVRELAGSESMGDSIGATAKGFDEKVGYRTISLLAVPMFDRAGEVIGVVELINKKREPKRRLHSERDFDTLVVPFDPRAEELAATLASQAGVSVENAILYNEIRRAFEGFVHASVTAIESRDPTTSGHSQRVALLSVELAEKLERSSGVYKGTRFTREELKELEYASLLHDFGKVGVREHVLVKAKKLYEPQRQMVLARFDYIRRTLEVELLRRKLELCARGGAEAARAELAEAEAAYAAELAELDEHIAFILKANEPTIMESGGFERLATIAQKRYRDHRGQEHPYLTDEEVACLVIPRGSLTAPERAEIESHVVHTYNFLRKIPWGHTLRNVPLIAGAHHERLDGSGYPKRLSGATIPLGARIMAITDIFDALTASDRPYKKAVPLNVALDILESERKRNAIDAELLQVFVEAKVYRVTVAHGPE